MTRHTVAGLLLAWSALPLHAHDSSVSSAIVRVADDSTLHVVVEMSAEIAMALYGVPPGTQGTPPNRDDILPLLTHVVADVYRFSIAGAPLELRDAHVSFREEDGIVFDLTFVLPVDWPDPPLLDFDAGYLRHVGSSHRAAISLLDAQGGVVAGRLLTATKARGTLPLRAG